MGTFQRGGSRSLRKRHLGCKIGKRPFKRFTPPGGRGRSHNEELSPVSAVINGKSGASGKGAWLGLSGTQAAWPHRASWPEGVRVPEGRALPGFDFSKPPPCCGACGQNQEEGCCTQSLGQAEPRRGRPPLAMFGALVGSP